MGINAGIKVIRRITDEQRWKDFLRAVIEHFKDKADVRMEIKINFDAPIEPSSCTSLRLFHLTEAFNFVPGDESTLNFWNTEFQNPNRLLYLTMSCMSETRNQFYETKRIEEEAKLKEATIAKLNSEAIRLNYTDVNLNELMTSKYLYPEQAIVFHVGEAPELPRYAHHFKAMESKISHRDGHLADVVMCDVYKLLQRFFPNHTKYWTEFNEKEEGYLFDKRVSYERQEQTDQFYRTLLESVNQNQKDNDHGTEA